MEAVVAQWLLCTHTPSRMVEFQVVELYWDFHTVHLSTVSKCSSGPPTHVPYLHTAAKGVDGERLYIMKWCIFLA